MTVPVAIPLKTTEGTLTVMQRKNGTFLSRTCSICNGHMTSRFQSHRNGNPVLRCRTCVCRENGFFRNWLRQTTHPWRYSEDAEFHSEDVYSHWWIEKSTVKLS